MDSTVLTISFFTVTKREKINIITVQGKESQQEIGITDRRQSYASSREKKRQTKEKGTKDEKAHK